MKTVGIICEYNPFHLGHALHIEKTRAEFGENCVVVCVMSGNYVQRGDFSVFSKHARAESAVRCGADLVVEMPTVYALQSAEGFAAAGVYILDSLAICDHISFGSESGDINALKAAAEAISSLEAQTLIRLELEKGVSYAAALQKAADAVLGTGSGVLRSPNNLLGVEYLKAIENQNSSLKPMTFLRSGGAHDGDDGLSASALRKMLSCGEEPWSFMPHEAEIVYKSEIAKGRGPVSMRTYELAVLARLRSASSLEYPAGASEGLENRFFRFAASESSVEMILEKTKTKRYAMSRIRRMLMSACLGITAADSVELPAYIRVLAMNSVGKKLLHSVRKKASLPIITKPATVNKVSDRAAAAFGKESSFTDFYILGFGNESMRSGGQEWRQTPIIIE